MAFINIHIDEAKICVEKKEAIKSRKIIKSKAGMRNQEMNTSVLALWRFKK